MKKLSYIAIGFILSSSVLLRAQDTIKSKPKYGTYTEKIIMTGIYKGKNIYVQNPSSELGGFCVVLWPIVNGNISTRLIKSPSFEIKLNEYVFKVGNSVEVILRHDPGCEPKILNPEAINAVITKK